MRCTRCDRIVVAESLGRAPDGELVFGWCPICLAEEGCLRIESRGVALSVPARMSLRRRLRRFRLGVRRWKVRWRLLVGSRRLAAVGIAGLMAVWSLILAFVGGWKWVGASDGKASMILAGSGMMAIVSLAFWILIIGRADTKRILMKIVQVAGAVVAFGTLAWGISRPNRRSDILALSIAAAGLSVSWAARHFEKRRSPQGNRPKTRVL